MSSVAEQINQALPGPPGSPAGLVPADWSQRLRQVLGKYEEPLLRQVAGKLVRPRGQWPAPELIERCLAAVTNPAVIDRRLKDLSPAERRLLALIAHGRQPRWKLVRLLELLAALGTAEGVGPVLHLFEAGLLYPVLGEEAPGLKNFEQWLGQAAVTEFSVFAHPQVADRALGEELGLPVLPGTREVKGIREADGLEWPLRLAALWQQVAGSALRRTQNEGFFKRDLDRLRTDPLLTGPPAESLAEVPDVALLAVALGTEEGLLEERDGELRAGFLPPSWEEGLPPALASLWSVLWRMEAWNPEAGWTGPPGAAGNPYPSALLLSFLLLARLPEETWVRPEAVSRWVAGHHPFWGGTGREPAAAVAALGNFLLGFAYPLRLLQAARDEEGEWVVRLGPFGRWLAGHGQAPAAAPVFPQTLLVQPNLEILAYRQGLTLPLITALTRFAAWKTLGSACTLQLQPDTVYRALEKGETFESIVGTLDRHGMKPTPAPVIESLRTWANKHERIGVYPSAVLLEFPQAEHLTEALARGLQAVRLSDRLAVVAREADLNYQLFRLTGTRDYGLPPEKCVEVEPDGVTLTVDLARSDLLLETEIQRFAEPVPAGSETRRERIPENRRQYRLTPESLAGGLNGGLSLTQVENWFVQRTGQSLSPAARLLLAGREVPALELRRLLVLTVPSRELADGLVQWPATRALVQGRLGETALVVAEDQAAELGRRLAALGIKLQMTNGAERT